MREGGNILRMGEAVGEVVSELQQRYPIGIEFELIANQPQRVERKVQEFVGNLMQAIAIVMIVMLISLGLRTGLVVSHADPHAAMLLTLSIMNVLGVGLDQMSLAALIIALGMLIDNAIVMSESILVQMQGGQERPRRGDRLRQRAAHPAAHLVADDLGRLPARSTSPSRRPASTRACSSSSSPSPC